ncbi:MAG: 5-formyltetrahydrofolate cyclo-ligase [Alistipes sp.]|nr:5-formyltetrahydrofolate cyclo-ligase [Alistipes sp.]
MTKSKSDIRRAAKSAVKALTAQQKADKSTLILSRIASSESIKSAKTVALYASLSDEVQSFELIELLSQTKRVVLPRVAGDDMDFYPYTPSSLKVGAFGIEEPQGSEPISPDEIDVIVVPGVAFTTDGKRCGRGKGYYDKYLSRSGFRAIKIGVCYAEQLAEDIPNEPHDIVMDYMIYG